MKHLAALTNVACAAAATLLLASACGGSSFSRDDAQAGSGGQGASGDTGVGNSAGKNRGGTSSGSAGSGTGGGVTAGAGGAGPGDPACSAPPVSGNCDAYFERWYHDPSTGLCRPFVYGGCDGNQNNYESFEQCQKACPGGSPNYDACNVPTDCAITGGGCCGVCDGPNVRARDLIAYNKAHAGALLDCAFSRAAPAPDLVCAPCLPPVTETATLKYFVPNCVQGQCVVEDLRTSPLTACEADADCKLRNGSGCCQGCGDSQPIALNVDSSDAFNQLVCGDTPPACPECEPPLPTGVAKCGASGHCEWRYDLAAGQ